MTAGAATQSRRAVDALTGRVYGIAGQVLNAATNVVTSYVAALLLVPEEFGRFVVAFGCVTVVLGGVRGLVGATMLVDLPGRADDERVALVGSVLGFTAAVGVAVSSALAVVALWFPVLWLFVPWIVVALLQDVGRYSHLAVGRTGRALTLDVVWAAVQVTAVLLGAALFHSVTLGLLVTSWGLGALGGLLAFVVLARPGLAHPSSWFRATRDVAGWFTAVAALGQVELYVVLLLAGALLGPADVAGLRAAQLLTYQPALVLLGSMLTVLQPAVVLASGRQGGLGRAWTRVTIAVLPVVGILGALALFREPTTALFFPGYSGVAHLVVPLAVQSAFVAWGVAPLAVLNGLRRGAAAFRAQALRTVAAAAAALAGALLGGLSGVAWALAAVAAATWLQLRSSAARAVRDHEADLATDGHGSEVA